MSLTRKNDTQEHLIEQIKCGNIIRVGATVDPDRRLGEYRRDGYRGTMICAETQNMKRAEDRLLEACKSCRSNVQKTSNVAPEKEGYVYGIKN